jgi:hypothetical protein
MGKSTVQVPNNHPSPRDFSAAPQPHETVDEPVDDLYIRVLWRIAETAFEATDWSCQYACAEDPPVFSLYSVVEYGEAMDSLSQGDFGRGLPEEVETSDATIVDREFPIQHVS